MDILEAFGIRDNLTQKGFCLALVGSGGKTTTLFSLARLAHQVGIKTVILSTTTHLAVDEMKQADHVISIHEGQNISHLKISDLEGVVLVCGPIINQNRVRGLSEKDLFELYRLASDSSMPLFLEADGSKRKPLKAPASHEPVIPPFAKVVVLVAGLAGLGKPLDEEFVHRPEQFSRLTGLEIGEDITPSTLSKALTHLKGGRQHIPPKAKRILLLNQVDQLPDPDVVKLMIDQLIPIFPRVIVGSMGLDQGRINAVFQPIAGVILAAGSASRFGSPKQILSWRGKPFIQHEILCAIQSGLKPVRIVLGAHFPEIKIVLDSLPEVKSGQVEVIFNPSWSEGLSTSIRAGINGLPEFTGGVVFFLADQPQIPPELVMELMDTRAKTRAWIVVPQYNGKRGNPTLFGWELFDRLSDLRGDTGGRSFIHKHTPYPIAWVPWDTPNLDLDIDSFSDYQHFKELDQQ